MNKSSKPAKDHHGPNRKQLAEVVKDRVKVSDVVGRVVKLGRAQRGDHTGLCPFHKEKTPSFTVNDAKGFWHCFGCGAHGSAIDFAMKIWGINFAEAVDRLARENGLDGLVEDPKMIAEREARAREREALAAREKAQKVAEANRLWALASRDLEGTPVWAYLAGRGFDVEALYDLGHLRALRFAGVMTYRTERAGDLGDQTQWPVMLAAMQRFDPATGESPIVAVHRTYLMPSAAQDGGWTRAAVGAEKLKKKMLGDAAGAAIRFTPACPIMNIAEGIETDLSVLSGAERPEQGYWASGALDFMPQVVFPALVEQVNMWTDNDMASDVGAERMRQRALDTYVAAGRAAREFLAPKGFDWNDVLNGKTNTRVNP